MNIPFAVSRLSITTRKLWYFLFFVVIFYNFHRYILKYGHGAFAKEGYLQTPPMWQVGKYIIIAIILGFIYLNSRFTTAIPKSLIFFYSFLLYVLLINIGSIFFYQEVVTDELEYIVFSFFLLPLGFVKKDNLLVLKEEIHSMFNILQYILIASNWIVIFNYYIFDTIPFHGYKGSLIRYGGLWDDPNAFAIICILLAGYAAINKQYMLLIFHIINTLLTVSLNGYLLIFVFAGYWLLHNSHRRVLYLSIMITFIGIIIVAVIINIDSVTLIYNAKKESIDQHSDITRLSFYVIPLLQPIVFHETWFLTINIDYFPASVPFSIALVAIFLQFLFFKPFSIQRLMYILFFTTSFFLPFLYMFPVNFLALLFLVLYTKGIQF